MTTTTQAAPSWLAVNALKLIKFGGLGFIALAAFAAAFTHMHDWTREALPAAADWLCWSNAVISEILPTVSFVLWREREEADRPSGTPMAIFIGSVVLSIFAQLSATGVRFPYDAQLLACLPALALVVLAKVALGDLSYARKAGLAAAAAAAERTELARIQAARDAELAAELARNYEREQAELAAELARQEREHAAELERERLRIEQAAITERAQLEAAERAELRRAALAREQREMDARLAREQRENEARLAREAEAARIAAEAAAERVRAEARRIEAEAEAKAQAVALLAARPVAEPGRHRDDEGGNVRVMRRRRSRAETSALVEAAIATLPAGTTRDEAVKVAALAIDNSERYAREFIPADWVAGSSAGGEEVTAA
jgi:hypothetical protein